MILDPSSLFWLKVAYISSWPPATSFLNFDSCSQFVISDTGARFLIKDLSVQLLILELRVRFLFYLKKKEEGNVLDTCQPFNSNSGLQWTTVDTDSFIKGWREDPNILMTKLM